MKTDIETLKKWIADSQKLLDCKSLFPEEIQEVVSRLAGVIAILAYDNIAIDEERVELKRKYGNFMRDV